MNKIKTLKVLTKLASELDQMGRYKQANFVDELITKIAENLEPVGEVYEKNGKFYRKFYDSAKGLIVKEVDKNGHVVEAPQPNSLPKAGDPPTNTGSNPSLLNKFYDLISALGGNREEAQRQIEKVVTEDKPKE